MVPPRSEWGTDEKGYPIGGCVTDDGKPNAHIWGMTNPPDMDTFWEGFLSSPPENCHVTIQPGGNDPKADWLEYLPPDYYTNLAVGKDPDWIDVYINAKFGKSLAGMPVFRSFSRSLHCSDGPLNYSRNKNAPIIVGMDVALHPAAVFGQVDYKGRILILEQRFPGHPAIFIIDPAGNTRAQTDEKTVLDVIRAEGLAVRTASTNVLQARLGAVDSALSRVVEGEPYLLIDSTHCADLITCLAGKYRYRRKKDGEAEDQPEKSHPWSDIADALQYLCLHADTSGVYNREGNVEALPVKRSNYRYV